MVEATEFPGTFERHDIDRFFHYTDLCAVPGFISAEAARVGIGNIKADGAKFEVLFDRDYGVRQVAGPFGGRLQQVVGKALSGLGTNARKLIKLLYKP
jgi:hypothetical protein